MTTSSQERMAALLAQLRAVPGLAESLPDREGAMVRDALAGSSVYEIAQQHSVSERAVWDVLGNAARNQSGQAIAPVETGGLGADTDPGVTGGYGDTGFGSIGNDLPYPVSEEPAPGQERAEDGVDLSGATEQAALEAAIARADTEDDAPLTEAEQQALDRAAAQATNEPPREPS
jgi:DNA-binding CsgD family transcriptional regulator